MIERIKMADDKYYYQLGEKNLTQNKEIQSLTYEEAEYLLSELGGCKKTVKGHEVFLIDLEGYFGKAALVFLNTQHLYYADEFELHYRYVPTDELNDMFLNKLSSVLFTEVELLEPVVSYTDYTNKDFYLRNYWIQQFDHVSIFYIGKPSKEQEEGFERCPYLCSTCFSNVADENIVLQASKISSHLEEEKKKLYEDIEAFRGMISYELANHEAGWTESANSALDAVGLSYSSLNNWQLAVVNEELAKQIEESARKS